MPTGDATKRDKLRRYEAALAEIDELLNTQESVDGWAARILTKHGKSHHDERNDR